MASIARTILTSKSSLKVFLRLCKRTHYTPWISQNVCERFPKEYKHILPYTTIATESKDETILPQAIELSVTEHMTLHAIMEESRYYNNTILRPCTRIQKVTFEEIQSLYDISAEPYNPSVDYITAMKKLTFSHLNGSGFDVEVYDGILKNITDKLPSYSDLEIKTLMQCLISFTDDKFLTNTHQQFLIKLNKECLNRFWNKDVNEMLLICDGLYQLKDHNSIYLWRAMRKICSKLYQLTGKQLVQVLFMFHVCKGKSFLNMYELERQLQECMPELSGQEVCIVARGFFLNRKNIRSAPLMLMMLEKIRISIDTIDDIPMSAFFKCVRFVNPLYAVIQIANLIDDVVERLPKYSLKCISHIAHACAGLGIYNKILIDKFYKRLTSNIEYMRIKDIEKFLHIVTKVAPPTEYYKNICCELRDYLLATHRTERATEIARYPTSFLNTLYYLGLFDLYSIELLQHAFEPQLIKNIYKFSFTALTQSILFFYSSVLLEVPEYKGPFLEEHVYDHLAQQHVTNDDIFRRDNKVKLQNEIVYLCKNELGLNVHVDFILPHHSTRYICFGLDENNKSVDAESILNKSPDGITYVKNDKLNKIKWKLICTITIRSRVYSQQSQSNYVNGLVHKYIKQIMHIGYIPLIICEREWLNMQDDVKINLLKELVYGDGNANDFLYKM